MLDSVRDFLRYTWDNWDAIDTLLTVLIGVLLIVSLFVDK